MLGAACKDVQHSARPQAGAGDGNGGRINGTDYVWPRVLVCW